MATAQTGQNDICVKEEKNKKEKEGLNLLGPPTFKELENGRFKCIETGHELPAKDMESYGRCKRCRLGLIDAALSQKKPPLNTFKQDPLCRSKLICKLTGDTINKSEEHIWKHISGRRFLNKLEQKETGKLTSNGVVTAEEDHIMNQISKDSKPSVNGTRKKRKSRMEKIDFEASHHTGKSSDLEELDFWIPPVGSRWDFDNGHDRWGCDSDSGNDADEGNGVAKADEEVGIESDEADEEVAIESEEIGIESGELSMQAKRMSIEVGPSSFASRKKKSKTDSTDNS